MVLDELLQYIEQHIISGLLEPDEEKAARFIDAAVADSERYCSFSEPKIVNLPKVAIVVNYGLMYQRIIEALHNSNNLEFLMSRRVLLMFNDIQSSFPVLWLYAGAQLVKQGTKKNHFERALYYFNRATTKKDESGRIVSLYGSQNMPARVYAALTRERMQSVSGTFVEKLDCFHGIMYDLTHDGTKKGLSHFSVNSRNDALTLLMARRLLAHQLKTMVEHTQGYCHVLDQLLFQIRSPSPHQEHPSKSQAYIALTYIRNSALPQMRQSTGQQYFTMAKQEVIDLLSQTDILIHTAFRDLFDKQYILHSDLVHFDVPLPKPSSLN